MKGEIIEGVYLPANDKEDWLLLKTNKSVYSLRHGGYKKAVDEICWGNFIKDSEFKDEGAEVLKVISDDFWYHIFLSTGTVIEHGEVSINHLGLTSLGVIYTNVKDYESDYFDDDEYREI